MAVSAFRSTSKRGNFSNSSSTHHPSSGETKVGDAGKKVPPRRSRSVSAVPRNYSETLKSSSISSSASASASSSSNMVDFLNTTDNPLFSGSSSPEGPSESVNSVRTSKFNVATPILVTSRTAADDQRGRSMSRSSAYGTQSSATRKGIGRSLSRVDTGRRGRSVSRGPSRNSESEAEQSGKLGSISRIRSHGSFVSDGQKKTDLVSNTSGFSTETSCFQTWSSRHPLMEPLDGYTSGTQGSNWEDGVSTSTFSEVEEKKNDIKIVSEQIKAMGRIYLDGVTSSDILDIEPQSLDTNANELVPDVRTEYSSKLEQSQERARKLRAYLAIEEQRAQELSRILKDMLPDTKASETQKNRSRRKASIERRNMSKRLMEEAMNYFDECVSISTFDNSDFSAPEDLTLDSVASTVPQIGSDYRPDDHSNASPSCFSRYRLNQIKGPDNIPQDSFTHDRYDLATRSSSDDGNSCKALSSASDLIATKPAEANGKLNIRGYIQKFVKEVKEDGPNQWKKSSYDSDEYHFRASSESLLFDMVYNKSRIDYGGLHLCAARIS